MLKKILSKNFFIYLTVVCLFFTLLPNPVNAVAFNACRITPVSGTPDQAFTYTVTTTPPNNPSEAFNLIVQELDANSRLRQVIENRQVEISANATQEFSIGPFENFSDQLSQPGNTARLRIGLSRPSEPNNLLCTYEFSLTADTSQPVPGGQFGIQFSTPPSIGENQYPTEKDEVAIDYLNMVPDDCLVIYLKKGSAYLKSHSGVVARECLDLNDTNAYIAFRPTSPNGTYTFDLLSTGNYEVSARHYKQSCGLGNVVCKWDIKRSSSILSFTINPYTLPVNYIMSLNINPPRGKAGDKFIASISLVDKDGAPISDTQVDLSLPDVRDATLGIGRTNDLGNLSLDITDKLKSLQPGLYKVRAATTVNNEKVLANFSLDITDQSGKSVGENQQPGVGVTKCKDPKASDFDPVKDKDNKCSSAAGQECRAGRGIDTAIGCIPTHPVELVRGVVRFAIGIAGGVALLLMILGAFTMITSAGNPDRINEGRERFSSAIIGLLVIIFAVLLMRLIGVDILGLDAFLGTK